jgi:cell division protein FtsB
MSVPATNRSMFNQSESKILERALHSMTLASDALTKENQQLREQITSLTAEVNRLKETVVLNP